MRDTQSRLLDQPFSLGEGREQSPMTPEVARADKDVPRIFDWGGGKTEKPKIEAESRKPGWGSWGGSSKPPYQLEGPGAL